MNDNLIEKILASKSPFEMIDNGGCILYDDPKEAYYKVITTLFCEFPRGYVDIPLFLNKYMGKTIRDAERLCKGHEIALIPFSDIEDNRRENSLRQLMQMFLRRGKHVDAVWNEGLFKASLNDFNTFIIRSNVNDKIQNGNLFNFLNV